MAKKISDRRERGLQGRIHRSRSQIKLYTSLGRNINPSSKKGQFLGGQIEKARIRKKRAKSTLGIKTKSTAGTGKGKGWHGESQRHSEAAKKGK